MPSSYIFALDIGTRSIVGVVMQETAKGLEIIAAEHLEHRNRAMVDGQIHDIEQVAKAIRAVKEKLETRLGQTLTQVAVAAAGRALRTIRLKINSDIPDYKEIHRDDILRLELQAVQEAQNKLVGDEQSAEEKLLNYHCVGYSVVNYELDGYKISNLYGQKGKNMGVDVIATFLPRIVVDSLFVALQRAELEMTSLTLEPIAASTVVVPTSMRQLNIALVDIGAGTSDIAITDDGSIIGYGMVPIAGDEVTDKISQYFLVDFNQAETIKRCIQNSEQVSFTDVLGVSNSVSAQEIQDVIFETVQFLAKQISERILELNGKTPQAIICIGGGSLTPLLKDLLAENLGLSKQRVAIRGREAISEVFGAQELVGPEAVTPIGIAVTAYERKGLGFAQVMVNEQQVRLFEVNRGTVADALLAAGVDMRKTQARLGMALTVTMNGELKIIKGGRGKPAIIRLNSHQVTIDAPVKHNDIIEFIEAEDGENGRGYISDIVPDVLSINVTIDEEPFTINPIITINGQTVSYNEELVDNARVICYLPRTVAEVLEISGHSDKNYEYGVFVNGQPVDPMTEINDGDEISIEKEDWNIIHEHEENTVIDAPLSGEVKGSLSEENIEVDEVTVVSVNGERIELPREDVILTDVLTRTSFPLRPPESGLKLEMTVNGVPAEFTTPLKGGDSITLQWK